MGHVVASPSGSYSAPSTARNSSTGTTYQVTAVGDQAFKDCSLITRMTIGDNVLTIGMDAFSGCSGITDLTLSSNLIVIGVDAFENCSALTSLTIPNSVTDINNCAFMNCASLTQVVIPNSVVFIGGMAFHGCSALTSVDLGENCRFNNSSGWAMNIFKNCPNLKSVTCRSAEPWEFQEPMFDESTYANATLYVPTTSVVNAYKATNYWSKFSKIVGLDDDGNSDLDEALNIAGGTIHFTSTGDYPWTVVTEGDRTYAKSGNAGMSNTTSEMTATVTLDAPKTLFFDFKAWGKGSGSGWDKCQFLVDGTSQFSYGARDNDWETYTVALAAGTHTLTWSYTKDNSVNPTGDYFAVDNVFLGSDLSQAVSDNVYQVISSGDYPWIEMSDGVRTYALSGNAGVASSTSVMTSTIQVEMPSTLSFDFMAWGEGSSTAWDKCEFLINDVVQFSYGARDNDWETYTTELDAGTYNLTWRYTKDSSVNPTGDYFAVDNLALNVITGLRGDVDDDGNVTISDVTSLIDYLLSGDASSIKIRNADCDLDGNITISDVTSLIDYLLSGAWTETLVLVGNVTFKMIPVKGGTFTMGMTGEQADDDEQNALPTHQVTVSTFSIGETEVTQALWVAVMGTNPSNNTANLQYPVNKVTWNDCQEFITKLNQMTGMTFRLPTEAEWEFAARGGNSSHGYYYAGSNTFSDVSATSLQPVGQKTPNELGLYDMSGSVWEWCQDYYGAYSSEAQTNPTGPVSGTERVCRGGAYFNAEYLLRVWYRYSSTPTDYGDGLGFRLAM